MQYELIIVFVFGQKSCLNKTVLNVSWTQELKTPYIQAREPVFVVKFNMVFLIIKDVDCNMVIIAS